MVSRKLIRQGDCYSSGILYGEYCSAALVEAVLGHAPQGIEVFLGRPGPDDRDLVSYAIRIYHRSRGASLAYQVVPLGDLCNKLRTRAPECLENGLSYEHVKRLSGNMFQLWSDVVAAEGPDVFSRLWTDSCLSFRRGDFRAEETTVEVDLEWEEDEGGYADRDGVDIICGTYVHYMLYRTRPDNGWCELLEENAPRVRLRISGEPFRDSFEVCLPEGPDGKLYPAGDFKRMLAGLRDGDPGEWVSVYPGFRKLVRRVCSAPGMVFAGVEVL